MSARLLQRVLKEREGDLAAAAGEEEEDESPPSAAPSRNPFDLLDDQEEEKGDHSEQPLNTIEPKQTIAVKTKEFTNKETTNRKSKKKKKKSKEESQNSKKQEEKSLDAILEDLSIKSKPTTVKEISNEIPTKGKSPASISVLAVDPKYLKAENELRKIFGSKVVNSFQNQNSGSGGSSRLLHGVRRAPHNPRKTLIVSALGYWPRWDGSISMEFLETKNGINYFRYVHSQSYSHAQEIFEAAKSANDLNSIARILQHYPYHIDSLLTFSEIFKYSGEHQNSADLISKSLFALECAFHPSFTPLQGNCQLKYIHDTNKPIFTALFNHMKSMDRRGCHRSALEVCKLLLSLDSDDPKGALFCIDYFSLRAQEYKWLERFVEEYNKSDHSLWLFPNFAYSLAIARFYLEQDESKCKKEEERERASSMELMKQALMLHPLVLQKLVSKAPLKDKVWSKILGSAFFGSAKAGNETLEHLINIYVERSYIIWRFPELQSLLRDAALDVAENVKGYSSEAKDWACVRREAFSSDRNEYSHLMVLDFSDTVPTIPPEELRPFMMGPEMMANHEAPPGAILEEVNVPERVRAPREVAGRNPAIVFLESLLPWVDYGDHINNEGGGDGQNQEAND